MKRILIFFCGIGLILSLYILSKNIPQQEVQDFIASFGIWGPLIFMLLVLITYIIAPFSSTSFVFIGHYLYGDKAILFITASAFVSFIINFYLAKFLGRSLLMNIIGEDNLNKIDRLTNGYGLTTLFFLRIFQGSLNDFLSYASGLTNMKFLPYIITSGLALIPGTIIWYYIASISKSPIEFTFFTILFSVGTSLLYISTRILLRLRNE